MSVDEMTRNALRKENLQLPPTPQIERIEPESYQDSSGEDSLEVTVVLSDATKDEDLTGENVMQISAAIRESLIAGGISLFPYVRLIKQSDYRAEIESG